MAAKKKKSTHGGPGRGGGRKPHPGGLTVVPLRLDPPAMRGLDYLIEQTGLRQSEAVRALLGSLHSDDLTKKMFESVVFRLRETSGSDRTAS